MVGDQVISQILEMAVAIQQIPAPTFSESQRGVFIRDCFLREGLSNVHIDEAGNVLGRLPGGDSKPPLVVSAHTDTIFPAATDLSYRREPGKIFGPGIGDNSLGVAGLFGLLWGLRAERERLTGDLWLAANVGEEGLGDLCGMRKVVKTFGSQVLAYIILEGMALGQVYHRALGVQRYRITARTAGGHSWVDYGNASAIHELAALITRLTAIPIPANPRGSLNIGVITGGLSVNTIAPEASLELDLRAENSGTLRELIKHVRTLVKSANRYDVQVSMDVIGSRPGGHIPKSHPLVSLAVRCLENQGLQPNLCIGSTDANIPLSQGLPAVCIGLTRGKEAHTIHEYIYTEPLAIGMSQLMALVKGAFRNLKAG